MGEYSDKWTDGPFKVLKDFTEFDVLKSYKRDFVPGEEYWEQEPSMEDFIVYLNKKGYIEDLENHNSWFLGGYTIDFIEYIEKIKDE